MLKLCRDGLQLSACSIPIRHGNLWKTYRILLHNNLCFLCKIVRNGKIRWISLAFFTPAVALEDSASSPPGRSVACSSSSSFKRILSIPLAQNLRQVDYLSHSLTSYSSFSLTSTHPSPTCHYISISLASPHPRSVARRPSW